MVGSSSVRATVGRFQTNPLACAVSCLWTLRTAKAGDVLKTTILYQVAEKTTTVATLGRGSGGGSTHVQGGGAVGK